NGGSRLAVRARTVDERVKTDGECLAELSVVRVEAQTLELVLIPLQIVELTVSRWIFRVEPVARSNGVEMPWSRPILDQQVPARFLCSVAGEGKQRDPVLHATGLNAHGVEDRRRVVDVCDQLTPVDAVR